ncbi:hypothetical protein [Leisingera sp. F5]|uniref:hypothetical protein n=1 Tax=Leisingera sp. F5 TaxID=1813816 RepID=UPI000AD2098F|nr:hypothetical protein [Leisingera sp. F5]
MPHDVGLEVSIKSVLIIVVDGEGEELAGGETSSEPDAIPSFLLEHAAEPNRIVHESGIQAIWLTRELEKRDLPIICVDPRLAYKALSGRISVTLNDRSGEIFCVARKFLLFGRT